MTAGRATCSGATAAGGCRRGYRFADLSFADKAARRENAPELAAFTMRTTLRLIATEHQVLEFFAAFIALIFVDRHENRLF
jgi:hypothetical protein